MHPGYAQQQQQQQQQHAFPPTIDAVPAEARLTETFAFIPGSLAIGGILGLIGLAVNLASQQTPLTVEDLYLPAGCLAVALLFGAWEIGRRLRRTAVVFHGGKIGIYRSGRLTDVAYPGQISIYQMHIANTIRELMVFGVLTLGTLAGGAPTVTSNAGPGLILLGAGLGSAGAFVSSIYARLACRHFLVPRSQGSEQVMFTRGQCERFRI